MNVTKHSKRLSYILRHAPDEIGLKLGDGGWVSIADLLDGFASKGWTISRDELEKIVATNDKKRFTISEDGLKIRAAQGHSVAIKSDLIPVAPPAILYHGTVARFIDAIFAEGLKPMSRRHVHLSADIETAAIVGRRRGAPIVLLVDAAAMNRDGVDFFRADNGVWLTTEVAPPYLKILTED